MLSKPEIEAAHANDIAATNLAQFIRANLTRPPVSLLVTSRRYLDWQGELGLELEGLKQWLPPREEGYDSLRAAIAEQGYPL